MENKVTNRLESYANDIRDTGNTKNILCDVIIDVLRYLIVLSYNMHLKIRDRYITRNIYGWIRTNNIIPVCRWSNS